jgi:pectate disaccharide-lyase
MRIGYVLLLMLIIIGSMFAQTTVYVDPLNGNDSNAGTIDLPLKTLAVAIPKVTNAGGYVYLRGGTYTSSKLSMSKIATSSSTIKIWAYGNEIPIIDFSSSADDGFSISGNYYHLKGLEIMHAPHNAIKCTGNNNKFETCKIHSNGNTGLAIGSSGSTYPSNNLILNCDSYLNYDAPTTGANADGFSAKWNIGTGNVFKGCRAWRNSDDGWDLWMAIATVEIDSCFAFDNGVNSWGVTLKGNNGNGFKLGGDYVATPHIVKNCVSFDNAGDTGRGFDENNDTAGQTLYNCVAFRNLGDNYHFTNSPITGQHIIKNCISYIGNVAISNAILSNNSWPSLTPVAADFVSIDTSLASAPRQANGNLANNGFFRLAAGSKFIDAGVNVGIPFMGVAPDIGAFEYPITNLSITALIQGRTNFSTSQMIPDTVSCVIRNGSVPFATVDSVKVSLNTNGQGTVELTKVTLNSNYYIDLKHRNSIKTWSNPVTFSTSNPTYDFTTSQDKAYGSNLIQVGSKWCIYSGDVNQDGFVTGDDFEGVDNDATDFTYHLVNDLNGDGFVTGDDFTCIDNNGANFIQGQVPAGAPGFGLKATDKRNNQ